LRDRPVPEGCALDVDQAEDLIRAATAAGNAARSLVHEELVSIAGLLRQPALWSLLDQGRKEPFIAEVLATSDTESLAGLLATRLPSDPDRVGLLAKYLKRVVVKVIKMQDSRPSRSTVERGEIEHVVGEFRRFLEATVGDDGQGQRIIVEFRS
jgi:hypothetical protein